MSDIADLLADTPGIDRRNEVLFAEWASAWGGPDEDPQDVLVVGSASLERGAAAIYGPAVAIGRGLCAPMLHVEADESSLRLTLGFVDAMGKARPNETFRVALEGARAESPSLRAAAQHIGQILRYAQDPLQATLEDVYSQCLTDPALASAMVWRRSTRVGDDPNRVVEVCFVNVDDVAVDPKKYGPGRYAVFVRDSSEPGVVVMFSDREWDAFVDGAKDGEFDV